MLKEFRNFAMRGNVIDLAVGVIIGTAFGKIVASLVGDVIMPLIGLLLGKIDFSGLAITVGSANIKYGMFIQSVADFIIISFLFSLSSSNFSVLKRKKKQLLHQRLRKT